MSPRYVCSYRCVECTAEDLVKWRSDNPDKLKSQQRLHRDRNAAQIKESSSRWMDSNTEYGSEWKKTNSGKVAAYSAKRRSIKLNATPDWLTEGMLSDIAGLYKESSEKDSPHHVDHIVPLQGENVCGLHVPWNLQVIPAEDNLRKSNRYG